MRIALVSRFQNTIIARYLMRNVLASFVLIFIIISLVFFGERFILIIRRSLQQDIPAIYLLTLVGFDVIQNVTYILTLSLSLAIILSISRFYKNSEMVIINFMGLGDKNFIILLLPITFFTAIFILFLTTYVIPWSEQQEKVIKNNIENYSKFLTINAGEFQRLQNDNIVFYVSEASNPKKLGQQDLKDIFVYAIIDNEIVVTIAKKAKKYIDYTDNSIYLHLEDGVRYYGFPIEDNKKILNFDFYDLQIFIKDRKNITDNNIEVEAKSTINLLKSDDLKDIAELQSRISKSISVLILSALSVLLGKTSTKGGKNLGVLVGVAFFVLYNNALIISQSSLAQGYLSPLVGFLWAHLSMLLIIILFYFYRHGKFLVYFDKISYFK